MATKMTSAAAADNYTPTVFRMNKDFDLRPEIDEPTLQNLDKNTRLKWQMRRFRKNPTFGFLENKLLSHEYMSQFETPNVYPQPKVLYGAFATRSMGSWPQYDRKAFMTAMAGIVTTENYQFVVKPLTSSASMGVLIMDAMRWTTEEWTVNRVADFCEQFLRKDWSYFGQRFEYVGVMVQQSIVSLVPPSLSVSTGLETQRALRSTTMSSHGGGQELIELKVHVVFGQLTGGRLEAMPRWGEVVDLAYCGSERPYFVDRYSWQTQRERARTRFAHYQHLLTTHTPTIRRMAAHVARIYGADMFRLDVFFGADGILYLNEVTYPSAVFHNDNCTVSMLLAGYRQKNGFRLEAADHKQFLVPLLQATNLTYSNFVASPDYLKFRHAEESVYDVKVLYVSPPEERLAMSLAVNWSAIRLTMLALSLCYVVFVRRVLRRKKQVCE